MCLNGYIKAQEYKNAYDSLEGQINDLEEKLIKEKSNVKTRGGKEKNIRDIKEYAQSISRGEEWSDAFYRNIVDKIVVTKGRKADIYLRQMPGKWHGKILAGIKEIENYKGNRKL